ncbi:MAG: GlsB/YeaQ/YmgE family stress response membrane protein [Alphaproteobacteria bacterium]
MEEQQIGWLAAILIGGIAGWLAEKFMKSDQSLIANIILGLIGAIIGNAVFAALDIVLLGWVGYLLAGFIGACLLIFITRLWKGRKSKL